MRTLLLRFSPTLLPSPIKPLFSTQSLISSLFTPFNPKNVSSKFTVSTSSFSQTTAEEQSNDLIPDASFKSSPLKSGLYLVATPIGNLEDITFRALRVLKSANVILSEDTRHSGKLLRHFNIKTPLLSYHKFNETQREDAILKRLQEGDIVALISDAGTPGISDPGMELTKLCIKEKIPVIPIPGASAPVAALSASGLSTMEFTFVGFLPKHAPSRKERLLLSANQSMTQIFFVPPHKLQQFLEETSTAFGDSRQCVIAREITKVHEEFWRGSLKEAREAFSTHQPKGEITLLVEGKEISIEEAPSEAELEKQLGDLISNGHCLSMVMNSDEVFSSILNIMFNVLIVAKRTDLGSFFSACK